MVLLVVEVVSRCVTKGVKTDTISLPDFWIQQYLVLKLEGQGDEVSRR